MNPSVRVFAPFGICSPDATRENWARRTGDESPLESPLAIALLLQGGILLWSKHYSGRDMTIILTGAGGMLAAAFKLALEPERRTELICIGREELHVTEPGRLLALIGRIRPTFILNCAAHTDVEDAERNAEAAFRANWILPGILGAACRREQALLVHFLSTGCYGRAKQKPYSEEDRLDPTTVHHRSKALGEEAIREAGCEFLILRTGWLFGGGPGQVKNFVWTRLVEARNCSRMVSDASQVGNPTFVGDVAWQTLHLIKAGLRGTYNCVSRGSASRFEYVRRMVDAARLPCVVEPTMTPFRRLAEVSPNEAAINVKLDLLGMNAMPEWGAAVDNFVAALVQTPQWLAISSSASAPQEVPVPKIKTG